MAQQSLGPSEALSQKAINKGSAAVSAGEAVRLIKNAVDTDLVYNVIQIGEISNGVAAEAADFYGIALSDAAVGEYLTVAHGAGSMVMALVANATAAGTSLVPGEGAQGLLAAAGTITTPLCAVNLAAGVTGTLVPCVLAYDITVT